MSELAEKQSAEEEQVLVATASGEVATTTTGAVIEVATADDAKVEVYRDLKNHKLESRRGIFIAEGPETIKMLLRSRQTVASVFLKP